MTKPVCTIVGVGPGNGASLARRFAADHSLALIARSAEFSGRLASDIGDARAYACDAGDAGALEETFGRIAGDLGQVDALVYNGGASAWGNVEEITPDQFEAAWRLNAAGLLTAAQCVIPAMKRKQRGSIIVIGATASRRGIARTAAVAPAKAAQRSLCESMARHLGRRGIHVALIIIDGVVDSPRARQRLPDKPDDFFVKPDDVAATAYWLAAQPPSAWSFEVEARPFAETW